MSDKLEILKMVESGKITVDEGLQMIEALELTEKIEDDVREEIYSKPIDGNEIKDTFNFDVSLITCKLNVERSNVDDVTIELMDDKTREFISKPDWLHLIEEQNTISIKESRVMNLSDIFDFFKNGNIMLNSVFINVKLPMEMVIDKGRFSNVSGSLSLIGLNGIDLEAKSVSGKVHVADLKGKIIQLKSISGAVVADTIKAGKAYMKTTSGKLKYSGDSYYLECKTVSGKISLHLTEPESFNLQLDSISGGIETNGFAIVNKSGSGKRSVNIVNRSDTKSIVASTVSGKISIDKL